ncbi:DUF1918 domain-containing protein [Amycolatopsis sp. NPDC023774]|uniref:DUF1918 domain-containing protein n=1 Tax=Amycolatopsis sp. NPDC023774 TaxID=3155015 RepID=UPI0033C8BAA9
MRARPGDRLVVKGVRVDLPEQRGRVFAVGGPDGTVPFTVRRPAADGDRRCSRARKPSS